MKLLNEKTIDLFISDINLIVKDDYRMLKVIKHDANLKTIPVLVISDDHNAEDRKNAIINGADECIEADSINENLLSYVITLINKK